MATAAVSNASASASNIIAANAPRPFAIQSSANHTGNSGRSPADGTLQCDGTHELFKNRPKCPDNIYFETNELVAGEPVSPVVSEPSHRPTVVEECIGPPITWVNCCSNLSFARWAAVYGNIS